MQGEDRGFDYPPCPVVGCKSEMDPHTHVGTEGFPMELMVGPRRGSDFEECPGCGGGRLVDGPVIHAGDCPCKGTHPGLSDSGASLSDSAPSLSDTGSELAERVEKSLDDKLNMPHRMALCPMDFPPAPDRVHGQEDRP